ncbi:MAG: fused MFS/spermidine synthase [Rhodospirillales bacterium]|nr:fused MFS/spermidine synthase [Rhodospirillales bacterium]
MIRQFAYATAIFISSACGLIIEIVAGRLIAPYVGMSLYTWTAIIAVVLTGLSLGHWIGGRLAGPDVGTVVGGRRVAIALGLAAISSMASLMLLRAVSAQLLGSGLPAIPSIILLTSALFLLPSLFVGIVSPILTKLAVDADPLRHGPVIGRMYALGTLGSIAGTLCAGYVFISWIGSTGTVIAVAVVYAVLGLAFAISDSLRALFLALLVIAGASLGWWGQQVQAFISPCNTESNYFCIRVADYSDQTGRPSALMALDHLVHSINDRDDPSMLYSPYIHAVDELLKLRFAEKKEGFSPRAFFIGGGGYSLPRAWAHEFEAADLIVAEIDPQVTRVAQENLWLNPATPGLTVNHRDARALLQSLPENEPFDLIFGDAFHDISIPPHLVTQEFHSQIARRLAPGGAYAINVVDAGSSPLFLFSLIKTLNKDFSSVEAWVEREEIGNPGRVTFIVIASDTPSAVTTLTARHGVRRTWRRWPMEDLEDRISRAGVPILSDDFAPVDRLMSRALLQAE